jgi:hypothetical protein
MPRKNTNEELWTVCSEFGVLRDAVGGTPGTTTTDEAHLAGVSVINVVDETDFTAGDWIRIDGGNKMEIQKVTSVAAGAITIDDQIVFDHVTGIAVTELVRVILGDITDDGVTRDTEVETAEIRAATQAGTYATLTVNVSGQISASLLNHSPENLLASLGIAETELRGTGTTGDPWITDIDFNNVGTTINEGLYLIGAMNDGTTVEIQGWGVEWEGTQSIQYVRGGTVSLPVVANVKHFRYYMPAV